MSDADHSVRSLAEILREHGLESEAGTRPGTTGPVRPARRKRTVDETRAEQESRSGTTSRDGAGGRTAEPGTGSGGPATGGPGARRDPQRPDTDRRVSDRRVGGRRTEDATPPPPVDAKAAPATKGAGRFGRRRAPEAEPATVEQPLAAEPAGATAAIPGLRTGRTPGLAGAVGSRSGADPVPSTGPIPKVVLPPEEDDEPLTAAQTALAWARFVGELVLALAVGVGVYYLFTVLWELLPYAAVVAAPLAIAGMVGGVAFWRSKHGQGPLPTRVLLLLLFAGTLLVVVPAAGLLAAR
ncbi:hypothetical protein SAMN03159343_1797 [Klenkia marina]|uniref:Uncharacterized protein n=1 Tax=Klenkia marina TaxID=1960309 RepID=A0A1G4XYZ7_9ACTN|nr:hypothetical protein [Klenkia marina]SCX46407.1 hypothetical protein SAMN03159343_1797 [Klenkia marina]